MKKQNLKKIITVALIVPSILTIAQIKASATWKENNIGWWYTDGQGYATHWKYINGEWYYFDNNGYMKTGWIQDRGTWYYLYGNGAMAKNTTINGYNTGSNGAWIQTTQNSSSNSEKDVKTAEDYVKSLGYEVISCKGEKVKYTLNENMLSGSSLYQPYQDAWQLQDVAPDLYYDKQIATYGFIVKNHPLEKIYKTKAIIYIMISDDKVIGGYSCPSNGEEIVGTGYYSIDGKTLEEVKGSSYAQWCEEWNKKHGINS